MEAICPFIEETYASIISVRLILCYQILLVVIQRLFSPELS
jgi:hypothetical protein